MTTRILVIGATGYIGGRLVPLLIEKGYDVHCLVRDLARVQNRPWPGVTCIEADLLELETLKGLFNHIDVVYYLVQSYQKKSDTYQHSIQAVKNLIHALKSTPVQRVIYLSSILSEYSALEFHASGTNASELQNIGSYLSTSNINTVELHTAPIIGAGSAFFEMIKNLVESRVILIPKNIDRVIQPISIHDVLEYLLEAIDSPNTNNQTQVIIGPDSLSFSELLLLYARLQKVSRILIHIPGISANLFAKWVHVVTPLHYRIAKSQLGWMDCESNVQYATPTMLRSSKKLHTCEKSLQMAIEETKSDSLVSKWTDALSSSGDPITSKTFTYQNTMLIDSRSMPLACSASKVFQVIQCIGGKQGWFYGNILWKIRGIWDKLSGGVGLQRGRRCQSKLRVGDVVDVWRVEEIVPNQFLRLRAEMKLPGMAWLTFELEELSDSEVIVKQTAYYEPFGFLGKLYWYSLIPAHSFIFPGMLKGIKRASEMQYSK